MSAETQTPAALELREVRGPSATGGGRRRFFDLLWLISATEFKKSFHGTAFGYLWSLVRPLMLFAVLLVVFTRIFKFDVPELSGPAALQPRRLRPLPGRDRRRRSARCWLRRGSSARPSSPAW